MEVLVRGDPASDVLLGGALFHPVHDRLNVLEVLVAGHNCRQLGGETLQRPIRLLEA